MLKICTTLGLSTCIFNLRPYLCTVHTVDKAVQWHNPMFLHFNSNYICREHCAWRTRCTSQLMLCTCCQSVLYIPIHMYCSSPQLMICIAAHTQLMLCTLLNIMYHGWCSVPVIHTTADALYLLYTTHLMLCTYCTHHSWCLELEPKVHTTPDALYLYFTTDALYLAHLRQPLIFCTCWT